jgi:hypothetical protein
MKRYSSLATLLVFALWPLGSMMAAEVEEAPEVIVVTGHLPGPPLWKVSNGDKLLWIFPYLDWIPKDMIWDSARVARVISESQEVLSLPERGARVSPLIALNPLNVVRGTRFVNQLERNPDGGSLKDNLSPEIYARFAALQARYFPREHGLDEVRPRIAGRRMASIIRDREGFVSGDDILKTIRRLVRGNRDIKRTEIAVRVELGSNYHYVMGRMKALVESFPFELEQTCFEQQVRHMEEDLDEMKSRANSWAQGYIEEFRNVALVFDESSACDNLFGGYPNPEQENMLAVNARLNQMWLDAADNALTTNASTFAILPIMDLLDEEGLLSKLKAKGYDVSEP